MSRARDVPRGGRHRSVPCRGCVHCGESEAAFLYLNRKGRGGVLVNTTFRVRKANTRHKNKGAPFVRTIYTEISIDRLRKIRRTSNDYVRRFACCVQSFSCGFATRHGF